MNDKLYKNFHRKIGLFLLLISFFASCSGGGGGNTTTPPTTFDFICPDGTKADGTTTTANTEKCTDCNAGFTLNADKCTADAGNFAYVCPNGTFASGTTNVADTEKCTECNAGFIINAEKCVASAPSPTFAYICPNGIIAGGTTSTANTEKCTDCNTNYMLNSEQCVASAPATFAYVCPNGTTADGTTNTANTEKCTACNAGFTINADMCVADAGTFAYVCPNGTIAGGTTSTANIEKCTACSTGYTLSSEQCMPINLISAGDDHTCAIRVGAAFCWGLQTDGRLGNGAATAANIATPTAVTGLSSGVTDISAGEQHTCAIQNGAAKCWGLGEFGRLGRDSQDDSNTPVQVTGLDSGVTDISAGADHTCAIQNGAAKCWGEGASGQVGNDRVTSFISAPIAVTGLSSGVTHISAGGTNSCAIHNGAAKCWGADGLGQLGNGATTTGNQSTAVNVTGLTSGVTSISVGGVHACAIQNGVAKCWGNGFRGALGNGDTGNQTAPATVSNVTGVFMNNNITSITAGGDRGGNGDITCVVRNGAAFCWGLGSNGELGNGGLSFTNSTAVQVTGLTSDVTDINPGQNHTCAVHNNLFKCWGRQLNGRLGNNVVTDTKQTTAVDITARFP